MKHLLLILMLVFNACTFAAEQTTEESEQPTEQTTEEGAEEENASEKEEEAPVNNENKRAPTIKLEYVEPFPEHEQQYRDLLAQVPAKEVVMLNAGSDQMFVLVRENNTGRIRGVMVFVPDWNQHQFSNTAMDYLRKRFNDFGWASVAMVPPAKPDPTNQLAELDTVEEASETEDTDGGTDIVEMPLSKRPAMAYSGKDIDTFKQQLLLRVSAAIDEARGYPGFMVIVAQGTSAVWVAEMINNNQINRPSAFVALSPYIPQLEFNQQVPEILSFTRMPLFDLFYEYDNQWVQATKRDRKLSAKKNFKLDFRQKEIFGYQNNVIADDVTFKEIFGWLLHLGLK